MPYLYVVRCNEFYKIGIAADVSARISNMQTGNPYPLSVCAYYQFDNPAPVEQAIHQRFSKQWQLGEWFGLTESDLSLIDSICLLLGGIKQKEELPEIQNTDDAEDAEVSAAGVNEMIKDGWRIEIKGEGAYKGKYYSWRRGSGADRESKPGGKFCDLPKDRQDEYFANIEKGYGQPKQST